MKNSVEQATMEESIRTFIEMAIEKLAEYERVCESNIGGVKLINQIRKVLHLAGGIDLAAKAFGVKLNYYNFKEAFDEPSEGQDWHVSFIHRGFEVLSLISNNEFERYVEEGVIDLSEGIQDVN